MADIHFHATINVPDKNESDTANYADSIGEMIAIWAGKHGGEAAIVTGEAARLAPVPERLEDMARNVIREMQAHNWLPKGNSILDAATDRLVTFAMQARELQKESSNG